MGLDLLFLKNKISKIQKISFVGTFFCAVFVHLYYFANGFPGRDSFLNFYTDQNIIGSGRWALSAVCSLSSYYDLPWVIGILSCLFIALTAVVIVSIFQIHNPILVIVVGGLLASAPSVTETLFFLYTADGYMIAMFLASLAVYLSRIEENRFSYWILSAACICVSCGIYQAYVSLSLILAVCYFMIELFQNRYEKKKYFQWIARQAGIFICALVAYYFIWKVSMQVQGVTATDYQGIAEVGTLSLDLLLNGITKSIRTFKWYFAPWSVATYGLTPYIALNLLFVLFFCVSIIIAVVKSNLLKRLWALFLVFLCLVAIIPFSSIWHFTSDSIYYRAMMLPGMTILYIFTALNFENWSQQFFKNLLGCFLFLVVLNNTVMANIGYFHMNLCYERTYAEGIAMMSEIRDVQKDHEINRYTVVGERYTEAMLQGYDPEYGTTNEIGQIQIFADTLDENLMIEGNRISAFLETVFGLELEYSYQGSEAWFAETDAVQAMSCWPEDGSVAVCEDVLVIKLSDE